MPQSFIQTINQIRDKLPAIQEASELFDKEIVQRLEELAHIDISLISKDLKKGNYLGNRKIDINLELNNKSTKEHVSYKKVKIVLNDGTSLDINFEQELDDGKTSILELTSHADIKNYIINSKEYKDNVINTELTVEDEIGTTPQMIRFRDADGKASNIDRIELSVYMGNFVKAQPTYYWAKTTSSLQTLANRVGDILALGQRIDKIIALADKEDEIQYLYDVKQSLEILYNNIQKIIDVEKNLTNIEDVNLNKVNIDNVSKNKANINIVAKNENNINVVSNNIKTILEVPEKTKQVVEIRDELKNIKPHVTMLASNEKASLSYDKNSGDFTIYIPQGLKGDRGEAFKIDAKGTLAEKKAYDGAAKGFAYLALDISPTKVFFKKSDEKGDWDGGIPFGKGDKGDKGEQGVSIVDVSFTSTTHKTGQAGRNGGIDTYTITFSNKSTHTFQVYNGLNSNVRSVAGRTGRVVLQKEDVGLENVDNTSDKDKPVSTATKTELDKKANISDIVDDLTSEDTQKPLSAKQGKALKTIVDNINTLLSSDDTTLDELQEIVNFIKQNKSSLDKLGITNIAGLKEALSNKVSTGSKQALHSSDALSISGHTLYLSKGDGTYESVNIPDTDTWRSISDSVSSSSSITSASSYAVKTAYSKAAYPSVQVEGGTLTSGDCGYDEFVGTRIRVNGSWSAWSRGAYIRSVGSNNNSNNSNNSNNNNA